MNNQLTFNNIDWKECNKIVAKLQKKIVVAWKKENKELVKSLQNILVETFAARALAVKKVISNTGAKTPGIDKEIWNTEEARTKAIFNLKGEYTPKPLKRIYIPKVNGKLRPISIPSLLDRAKQALHLMALDPIAEEISDKRSYGFRKYRSCQDAIEYLHICLGNRHRARFILEADIKGYFDNLSHDWIYNNVPMDKKILKLWLKAGYFDKNTFYKTETGVPQGGIISPTIANIALTGLETAVENSVKHLETKKFKPKVNTIRYADDFVVTAANENIIYFHIIPAIQEFLKIRGLELNFEKTKTSTIEKGFDFLGYNIRKYKDTRRSSGEIILIKPSKKSMVNLKQKIAGIFQKYKTISPYILISKLNPILRGWGNYFRNSTAKRAYTHINYYLWIKLWKWARKKKMLTKEPE